MSETDIGGLKACPKCGLEAKSLLHPFCKHHDCPIRDWASSRPVLEEPRTLSPQEQADTERTEKWAKERATLLVRIKALEAALSSTEQETREKVVREIVAWLRNEINYPEWGEMDGAAALGVAASAIERNFLTKSEGGA